MKMKHLKVILILMPFLFLFACSKEKSDGKHPFYVKADLLFSEGKYEQASELYLKYLKINPNSAMASYKLGSIYQEEKDYIKSIYYYEKFLSLEPNTSDSPIIKTWIENSKKNLYSDLSSEYSDSEIVRESEFYDDLTENYQKLVEENANLKANNQAFKNIILKNKKLFVSNVVQEETLEEPQKIKFPFEYTVQQGDFFAKISQKFYGTSKFANFLFNYNKKVVESPDKLKIGTLITIPTPPKEH